MPQPNACSGASPDLRPTACLEIRFLNPLGPRARIFGQRGTISCCQLQTSNPLREQAVKQIPWARQENARVSHRRLLLPGDNDIWQRAAGALERCACGLEGPAWMGTLQGLGS